MRVEGYITACVLLMAVSLIGCSRNYGVTKEQVDRLIATEIPAGASKDQVIAFLDANKIKHSGISDIPQEILDRHEMDSNFSNAKLDGKRVRIKRLMGAKIPDVDWGFLTSWDIFITFYFDENDRLVEHLVRKIGTGP